MERRRFGEVFTHDGRVARPGKTMTIPWHGTNVSFARLARHLVDAVASSSLGPPPENAPVPPRPSQLVGNPGSSGYDELAMLLSDSLHGLSQAPPALPEAC